MTDLQAKLALLPIFKALDVGELQSVAGQVQLLNLAGGSTLISEGDEANDMFVVLAGLLGVFKRNVEGNLEFIAQVEPGTTVGEMGLLSDERRNATVIALRDTELIRLSKQVFEEFVSRYPAVMRAIAGIMTTRLRNLIHARVVDSRRNADAPLAAVFRRTGEYWTVIYEKEECLVKDAKGLHYIACLLRQAGRDIHALELVAMVESGHGSNRVPALEPYMDQEAYADNGVRMQFFDLGDAGEMLDGPAKAAYKHRLAELREELSEAKERGDEARGAKAEDEIAVLSQELSRAIGLGGRDRRAASTAERARLNVTRSIKIALERIAENSPRLGDHLKRRIRTGAFCAYRPDPDKPINWQF